MKLQISPFENCFGPQKIDSVTRCCNYRGTPDMVAMPLDKRRATGDGGSAGRGRTLQRESPEKADTHTRLSQRLALLTHTELTKHDEQGRRMDTVSHSQGSPNRTVAIVAVYSAGLTWWRASRSSDTSVPDTRWSLIAHRSSQETKTRPRRPNASFWHQLRHVT